MKNETSAAIQTENEQLKHRLDELERQKFELDKKIFELKVLYDIARETTTTQDLKTMLKVFLSMTMGTFGIVKGLITIYHDDKLCWELIASSGIDFTLDGKPIDIAAFQSFSQVKEAQLISDSCLEDAGCADTTFCQWLQSVPLKIWTPILADNQVIGGICLGEKISGEEYYQENLNLLSIIATNCALNIRNARLFQENIEKERIERENRELKRLDKKKNEFVNMVAHELRTPLTSISGFSELMMKKAETKPRESLVKFSKIIFQESDRLRRIINDLLDLSRIKSGKVEMEKMPNDLKTVIETACDNVQLTAEKKKIVLYRDLPASIPSFLFDKDKMTQVMLNLLSNSIKYTREGGTITVTARTTDSVVRCEVKDTGVGIPAADLKKVFEEFHRVNNELSKIERGTGLGLSITKSIIEAHDGRIWVESQEEIGSSFFFELPYKEMNQ
ncbi:hypothetical protein JXQ70_02200 [bacterium]|nr:hypothetical protein [bacterium]